MQTSIKSHRQISSLKGSTKNIFSSFQLLNFDDINLCTTSFAAHIEKNFDKIVDILLDYESFEVVQDEIARTLDLLKNLRENREYFVLRIGEITSFLPRNQPLYALSCFVLVPSLMASEVHFRIPHSMRIFFPNLLEVLDIESYFPNVVVSTKERLDFLKERASLYVNADMQETWPVTDAVIFTGTSSHAEKLRLVFDARTLFIANGAGHNPVVISKDADIQKAVEATLSLQFYNQGQDCAAPNAILVHDAIFSEYTILLKKELRKIQIGKYRDRNCRIGPISDSKDLVRIQNLLIENQKWLDLDNPGIIRSKDSIVEPTIVYKPLKEGGNFIEVFAPIIFVQKYYRDSELSLYFENANYEKNAMYISIFGSSEYIDNIVDKPIGGKLLHDKMSILRDTHLHVPGIERGTKPYGGYGYGASSISLHGQIISKPTLPQRDIYECLVKPLLNKKTNLQKLEASRKNSKIVTKDVQKILGIKSNLKSDEKKYSSSATYYIDSRFLEKKSKRYIEIPSEHLYSLLDSINLKYLASMSVYDIENIRALRSLLLAHKDISVDEFTALLYALPRKGDNERADLERQLSFFTNIYQLVLGRSSGPRLSGFLLEVNREKLCNLLDV